MGKQFADCLAYMIKFANYFEIELEECYYKKMDQKPKNGTTDVNETIELNQ
ncbi:hypothetical protein [Neobacillus vireti]|uniref:hypothetical protein n=1 Tax=Neobacillus vireti TaxID=220686 RepID=UPI0030004CAD